VRAGNLILYGYGDMGNEQRSSCNHLNDDEVHVSSSSASGGRSVLAAGDGSMTNLTFLEQSLLHVRGRMCTCSRMCMVSLKRDGVRRNGAGWQTASAAQGLAVGPQTNSALLVTVRPGSTAGHRQTSPGRSRTCGSPREIRSRGPVCVTFDARV